MTKNWHRGLGLVLVSLVCVTVALVRPADSVKAAAVAAAQVTSFKVTGPDGKVITTEPLRAGAVYTVDFVVNVAAGINDKGLIKTSLVRPQNADRFWTLKGTYAGIDTATWQPGQSQISFNAVAGDINLQLVGQVPADYVSTTLGNGDVVHVAKDITLIGLSLASGTALEDRALQVIDNPIDNYRQALSAANDLLKSSNADPRYAKVVSGIVEQAKAIGDSGYVARATALLAVIPAANDWIAPQGSTVLMWVIIGILVVLAALFLFMLMRARSEVNLMKSQADEQAKRLELLAAKATRIGDSTLGNDISKVKSELEDLVGR